MKKILIPIFITLFITGCASIPEPIDTERSIIGISMIQKAPIGIFSNNPTKIFFVCIDEKGNIFNGQNFIESNYVKNDTVYLINARPGRYVAVASYLLKVMFGGKKYEEFVFFTKDVIKETEIIVKPGEIAFMGNFTLKNSKGNLKSIITEGDEAQKNYGQLLKKIAKKCCEGLFVDDILSGNIERVSKTAEDKKVFIEKAKKDLEGTVWLKLIK